MSNDRTSHQRLNSASQPGAGRTRRKSAKGRPLEGGSPLRANAGCGGEHPAPSVYRAGEQLVTRKHRSPTPQIDPRHDDQHTDGDSKYLDPTEVRRAPRAQWISEPRNEVYEKAGADHDPREHWIVHARLLRLYSIT